LESGHARPESDEKTLVLAVEKNVWVETAVADLKVWQHVAKKLRRRHQNSD
jgi:hypothetical protein